MPSLKRVRNEWLKGLNVNSERESGPSRCWELSGFTTWGLVGPTKDSSTRPKSRIKPLNTLNQTFISEVPLALWSWFEVSEGVRSAG